MTRLGDELISAKPAISVGEWISRHHLRILAYHGVVDVDSFANQMRYVRDHYHPVSPQEAVAALHGDLELPPLSVWVTFDDGDPSIVEKALPILRGLNFRATAFICPGLVDTTLPHWWQLVAFALAHGVTSQIDGRVFGESDVSELIRMLKLVDDVDRRRIVEELAMRVETEQGSPYRRTQITSRQLTDFVRGGGTLGNHTWDHPCLDRCDPAEVHRQIRLAHDWISDRFSEDALCFAYPNGNHSAVAELALRELGYEAGLLFDHKLTRFDQARLRLSRLRVNDSTPIQRFEAILSGVHPAAHALLGRR